MEIEQENDEIEKEIDVIFTNEFINDIKIFQFPLIPKNSLNTENINSLKTSRDSKLIKIDMNIDPKYQDKNNYNAEPVQSMIGEKIESNANLCIGKLKNDKLYITPISQIYQFRHDFSNIEKDNNTVQLNKKKDKKETKNNNMAIKQENIPITYENLTVHQSDSINSKIILEKISNLENNSYSKKADFMSKDDYFNLLLKYVISPETNSESNIDLISNYVNKMNLEKIDEKNDEMEIETEKKEKKNRKTPKKNNILINNEKEIGIIGQNIKNIFGEKECLYYNNLLGHLCEMMNIKNDDKDNYNLIKNEINNLCVVINDNYCFIKDKEDCEDNDVRLLLIDSIGNSNGMKKQQIKQLIAEKGLNIQEAKLNKILKSLCEYIGSNWVMKPPMNI